jgi:hypothetical protein
MPHRIALFLFASFTAVLGVALPAWPAEVDVLDYRAPVPDHWIAGRPASSMRLLQYRITGKAGDARFIVYYFGPGQGGSAAVNVARWRSQFTAADGGPVTPALETYTVNGWPVTLARFAGSYARGVGSGPQGRAVPDQALTAAVIETPQGAVIAQLFGPAQTVRDNEAAYRAFVSGIRQR